MSHAQSKNSFEYFLTLTPIGKNEDYRLCQELCLDLAIKEICFDGVFCEFGVYKGKSARHIIRKIPDSTHLYLFDCFTGLPEDWQPSMLKGRYAVKKIPVFKERNVTVVNGLFQDTLKSFKPEKDLSFIHIDSDLYSSCKTVLTAMNEYIKPGTVILFDELYNYKYYKDHEYKALIEWVTEYNRDFEYTTRSASTQAAIRVLK